VRHALYELVGPHVGPCAICGHPDKRHRMVDVITERVAAGDSVEDVAGDYGLDADALAAALDVKETP
jgi:hypothetical protein